ncbi:MAG: V-type ATPase 116kDa subunit family protein [Desulfobacterales bacterium]
MIAEMEKLFIAGPKRLAPAILANLQCVGVVQIDPLLTDQINPYRLSQAEESQLERWDAVAAAADHALKLCGLEADPSANPFADDLKGAEAAASAAEQRAAVLVETQESLRQELELIGQYRPVVELLAKNVQGLDESPWLTVLSFLVDRDEELSSLAQELTLALDDRFLLVQGRVNGAIAAAIVVLKRDAEDAKGVLSHQGLGELPLPEKYGGKSLEETASQFRERSRQVPQSLASSEEEMRRYMENSNNMLKSLWNRAKDESGRLLALRNMAAVRYGFALFGWVPARLKHRVVAEMDRFDSRIHYAFERPEIQHEAARVPVLLENPAWIKPFESLISFLNTPMYGSRDPTWVVAVFFPFWFGMIVGDIGYAAVFAGVAWYLSRYVRRNQTLSVDFFKMRLAPDRLAQVVCALKPMILWTMIWGLLYGEFFGDFLQRLRIFGTMQHPGWIPLLIPRTDTVATANGLILFSIGFGVYQVLYGFYLKAVRTHRFLDKMHFWEASGYFGGVAALVLFAYAFMAKDYRWWLFAPMVFGAAIFVLGMLLAKAPLMMAELPTQGGHIMSYIRIYAVGLASAILANLATDLGFSLGHLLGIAGFIIGMIAGLLIGLLLHALLILLLTVSHFLQPIRLIWVEFFTKFDFYSVSGRPYHPFQSICNSSL